FRRVPCSPLSPYTTLFRSQFLRGVGDGLGRGRLGVPRALLGGYGGRLGWTVVEDDRDGEVADLAGAALTLLALARELVVAHRRGDRKSTRLNSSHVKNSYA